MKRISQLLLSVILFSVIGLSCQLPFKDDGCNIIHLVPYGYEGELNHIPGEIKSELDVNGNVIVKYSENGHAKVGYPDDCQLVKTEQVRWITKKGLIVDSLVFVKRGIVTSGQGVSFLVFRIGKESEEIVKEIESFLIRNRWELGLNEVESDMKQAELPLGPIRKYRIEGSTRYWMNQ